VRKLLKEDGLNRKLSELEATLMEKTNAISQDEKKTNMGGQRQRHSFIYYIKTTKYAVNWYTRWYPNIKNKKYLPDSNSNEAGQ